jgi:hypothetical protein
MFEKIRQYFCQKIASFYYYRYLKTHNDKDFYQYENWIDKKWNIRYK